MGGTDQRDLVGHLLMMAAEQGTPVSSCRACLIDGAGSERRPPLPAPGDHVEVEFEGKWFPGVLQWLEDEFAHVHCDVDAPHVLTMTHLSNVRPAVIDVTLQRRVGHVRSRSTPCL